jgi:hypothetical protein
MNPSNRLNFETSRFWLIPLHPAKLLILAEDDCIAHEDLHMRERLIKSISKYRRGVMRREHAHTQAEPRLGLLEGKA